MRKKIRVGALMDLEVLFPGDIHELACFLLKVDDAKVLGPGCRSRHTPNGIARKYAMITDVDQDEIVELLKRHGLPMNAAVEHDEDMT